MLLFMLMLSRAMHFECQCNLGITIVEDEWNCGNSEERRD